jgi:superoxide reductase
MQRRILAKSAFATAAVALPLAAARAQSAAQSQTPMSAGLTTNMDLNLIFTSANPGHWAGVESLHVPDITVSGSTLTVRTPHPMSQPHYIVSHTVVLEGGKFLDRKTFTWTDQPVSVHTLPDGYRGQVTVTSTCNLHDFWMATITV